MAKIENFSVDLSEMRDAIEQLGIAIAVDAMALTAKEAMKPVKDQMQRDAHEDTGILRRSIGMSTRKGGRQNKTSLVRCTVGPIRKTAQVSGKKKNLGSNHQKAIAQEYGNIKFKQDEFIRKALDDNKERVLNVLVYDFRRNLERVKGRKGRA